MASYDSQVMGDYFTKLNGPSGFYNGSALCFLKGVHEFLIII